MYYHARFLNRVGKKGIGMAESTFITSPPPLLSLPTLDSVFWAIGRAKVHRCPSKSLNVKQKLLFNYHNTILFLHKIQGGQSSPGWYLCS